MTTPAARLSALAPARQRELAITLARHIVKTWESAPAVATVFATAHAAHWTDEQRTSYCRALRAMIAPGDGIAAAEELYLASKRFLEGPDGPNGDE